MDIIPFDARRFQSAAAVYLEGRPPYPQALFERVVELCGLEPTHRIMDLGCGPGQIAIALAPYVGEVVAVDPEVEMLRVARDNANDIGVEIAFVEASSYDIGPDFGEFRMVAMGRSFHWMDRVETLSRLDAMIEPLGAVVLMGDHHPTMPDNAWRVRFEEVVAPYAQDDVAKTVRQGNWLPHKAVLLDSAFDRLEQIAVIERRTVSVDALILRAQSMSSTANSRLGDKAEALEKDLRAALAEFAPEGELREVIECNALIARRSLTD